MQDIKLPQLGQSVEEAEIVSWLKQEGDTIAEGEPIFTVQTDKAEIEVEATASGVLRKILVQPGVEVPVLTVVALVGTADEALPDLSGYTVAGGAGKPAATAAALAVAAPSPAKSAAAPMAVVVPATIAAVSPRARKLAAEHHVDAARLAGSGVGGRVMDSDVRAFLEQLDETRISPTARRLAAGAGLDVRGVQGSGVGGRIMKADVEGVLATSAAPAAPSLADQRVPLTPMRRIIAERMGASKFTAPHYYVTVEIDMSAAKAFRAGLPYKVSYNDLVLRSVALTLREFPAVNARWAGDAIELVGDINLGMAVALPTGLIVPVIRNADTLTLEALGNAARGLAEKAQKGKLLPDDYSGNTFTVSNLGAFGVDHFTAIINQPDSAIIAVGQMKDRVVAIDGGIHIRPIMKLTISSDHRVIDGALAAQFMGRLRERMETAAF
jgi:pyruvate dehydrogenase E2 component (dihydrolipoamide acetyltransferase)